MRRTHASRRLLAARVINYHAILLVIPGKAVPVGGPLLLVLDVRGIPFQNGDIIRACVLHPIAAPSFSRLCQHHGPLGYRSLNFIRIFRQVNIGDPGSDPIRSLLDVDVGFIVQQTIGIGIFHQFRGRKDGYNAAGAVYFFLGAVKRALHMTPAFHPLFIPEQRQRV